MSSADTAAIEARRGLLAALTAFATWGIYPIFFRQLAHIEPMQILAWRVIWSCTVLVILFTLIPRLQVPWHKLRSMRQLGLIVLATTLISINWFVFIYAVSAGEILQASLGYFLNPTLSALLGIAVFGERLNRLKQLAIVVALLGMMATFLVAGVVPVLSLSMACSFALYSAIRKRSILDSASGLYLETLLLLPLAALYLAWTPLAVGTFEPVTAFWLVASGIMTLIPLLSAVYATRRIPLSTFGLFQYIAPTMHLLIAIGLYNETLDLSRTLAFAVTLASVSLFVAGILRDRRQERRRRIQTEATPLST